MNQADFRDMLATATPRASASTSRARAFGAAPKRQGGEIKEEKPTMKPRAQGKSKFKGKAKEKEEGAAGTDGYRDRAADRRLGKDNEFSSVEKMLEDYKARSDVAEDRTAMEDQMKYLGGDAEHSVLVKGLDFALLERMKHEQSRESDQTIEDAEAELDKALAVEAIKPKKRTRDELLQQLKAGKSASGPTAVVETELPIEGAAGVGDGFEKAKAAGRFKSIAKPEAKAKGKGKETIVVDGKVKRRKKKVKLEDGETPKQSVESVPTPSVLPPPLYNGEDDDDDIFGGVAEYGGVGSDSDDDAKPTTIPPPSALPSSTTLQRSYFDDDGESSAVASGPPSAVANLATGTTASTAPKTGAAVGEVEEEEERPMRLQGFSGSSVLSVRDLLDMDAAETKEEERKAKKQKFRVIAGEKREKILTEEDKLNRDYQALEKYMADKEKPKADEDD